MQCAAELPFFVDILLVEDALAYLNKAWVIPR
jgi:hypothetical protein